MSKWEMVKLGDVCEIIAGQSPPSETYNNIGLGLPFFQGKADFGKTYPNKRVWCSKPKKIAQPGDILLSVRAPVGPTNLCNIEAAIGRGLSSIRSSNKVNTMFLRYYLKCNSNILKNKATGSTFKAITQSTLKNFKIPLPPLDIQIKIADALEKTESLISLKKEQIESMDELIQSLFYDMFGDPVNNPKGWDVSELGLHLDSIDSGWSPKCLNSPADKKNWGVLKLSAVTGNKYKESENKQLPIDVNPKESKEVKVNDLLFTRKNTIDLVGACAYVYTTRSKLMMPDIIFRLNTKGTLSKLYLWGLFTCKTFRSNITSLAGGSAASMLNISKAKLSALDIPIPPISLQNEFADKVIAIEKKKEEMVKGLEELEVMFKSIMQKSFRGELF